MRVSASRDSVNLDPLIVSLLLALGCTACSESANAPLPPRSQVMVDALEQTLAQIAHDKHRGRSTKGSCEMLQTQVLPKLAARRKNPQIKALLRRYERACPTFGLPSNARRP
jgi:hypothetical protein